MSNIICSQTVISLIHAQSRKKYTLLSASYTALVWWRSLTLWKTSHNLVSCSQHFSDYCNYDKHHVWYHSQSCLSWGSDEYVQYGSPTLNLLHILINHLLVSLKKNDKIRRKNFGRKSVTKILKISVENQ